MMWCLAVAVAALCGVSDATDKLRDTRTCLDCICFASTKCNPRELCNFHCGPYLISESYWIDAGRPRNSSGFAQCAQEKACAEDTIVRYMNTWGSDCDNDGEITCGDYARMHKAGRMACHEAWVDDTLYWKQFNQCMKGQARGRMAGMRLEHLPEQVIWT